MIDGTEFEFDQAILGRLDEIEPAPDRMTIDNETGQADRADASPDGDLLDTGEVLAMVFGMAALRLGPHWELSGDESRKLGAAIEKCAGSLQLPPWAVLMLVSAQIIGPKIAVQIALNKQHDQQEPQDHGKKSAPEQKEPAQPVPGNDRVRQDHEDEAQPVDETQPGDSLGPRARSQDLDSDDDPASRVYQPAGTGE